MKNITDPHEMLVALEGRHPVGMESVRVPDVSGAHRVEKVTKILLSEGCLVVSPLGFIELHEGTH